MNTENSNYDKTTNTIRKIARVWSLVIFALALIILIAEIIEAWLNPGLIGTYPWYENLIPLSLFLGVIGLMLAWRWEGFGSILSIVCVIANYVMYIAFGGQGRGLFVVPVILLPVLIPGILFLISWLRTDRDTSPRFA
ncbi:MAG: hypothetical protein V3U36_04730 [Anaerolineales bacterium]